MEFGRFIPGIESKLAFNIGMVQIYPYIYEISIENFEKGKSKTSTKTLNIIMLYQVRK